LTVSTPTSNTYPQSQSPPHGVSVGDKRLLWKIDLRILPLLFCVFFLQFLDKVIYNVSLHPHFKIDTHISQYANVMNLQQDLHMSGNDYTWGATAFFIGYAVSELPQCTSLDFAKTKLTF
jgi:hypothetical protein